MRNKIQKITCGESAAYFADEPRARMFAQSSRSAKTPEEFDAACRAYPEAIWDYADACAEWTIRDVGNAMEIKAF